MNATECFPVREDRVLAPHEADSATGAGESRTKREVPWTSVKIQPPHRERLAIVYIRQSTQQQVLNNRESRERQYALADHAVTLGWSRDRVVIIDEDQAHSGKTAEKRTGFHRVMAEVAMDHVGLVLGIELSRMARSCKDWHQLFELCAVFGTLLADEDGLYDANDPNDRLILGLKGIISEMELHTMQCRLTRGQLHKAQRGDLFLHVPVGYVKTPEGGIALDPDEQVRSTVQLIFDKFVELGSGHAALRYLLRHGIKLGVRPIDGPRRGQVEWRRPCSRTVFAILHHPMYAGCYSYGRCPVDLKYGQTHKTHRRWVSLAETKVVLRDHVPAYITWEHYEANLSRMRENRSRREFKGATRRGTALLSGIVFCGACGRRMSVAYCRTGHTRYECLAYMQKELEKHCRGVSAPSLDTLVEQQVLRVLEPASLELSLRAAENIQRERDRLTKHWKQQLERTQYAVHKAERHYRAVDPENRLVARTLEQEWEQSLNEAHHLQEEFDRFRRGSPLTLSVSERQQILALSSDIAQLWNASSTGMADRKEIVRSLVERVTVNVRGDTEYVDVTIHWAGEYVSQHTVIRPLLRFRQLEDFDRIKAIAKAGREAGLTCQQIADQLNREGFHPPSRRGRKFTRNKVSALLRLLGLRHPLLNAAQLAADEWWLSDLAVELSVTPSRLHHWLRHGYVQARKEPKSKFWILWADADELARLCQLRDYLTTEHSIPYPQELKRPKPTPSLPAADPIENSNPG